MKRIKMFVKFGNVGAFFKCSKAVIDVSIKLHRLGFNFLALINEPIHAYV